MQAQTSIMYTGRNLTGKFPKMQSNVDIIPPPKKNESCGWEIRHDETKVSSHQEDAEKHLCHPSGAPREIRHKFFFGGGVWAAASEERAVWETSLPASQPARQPACWLHYRCPIKIHVRGGGYGRTRTEVFCLYDRPICLLNTCRNKFPGLVQTALKIHHICCTFNFFCINVKFFH